MKVLLIHTHYLQKGGEDLVVEQEFNMLKNTCTVERLIFKNKPGLLGAIQFLLSIYNPFSLSTVKKKIKEFKPDIVHLHNFHYALGPAVINTIKRLGVPLVYTIHNYRILCPSTYLLHNNKLFTESLKGGFPWAAVKYKVYRNSYIQTFWTAFTYYVHNVAGTWKKIDKVIVLTDFVKSLYSNSKVNIDNEKLIVKPNFLREPEAHLEVRSESFLFIGRLSDEKGVNLLLETFAKTNLELKIAGDGPLKSKVLDYCNKHTNITYLGVLNSKDVLKEMTTCSALLFPSIWFEGMPMTLLEAFATGTVPIVSKLGSMESMITAHQNGLFFDANNSDSLLTQLVYWQSLSLEGKNMMRNKARATFDDYYTEEKNTRFLQDIYNKLLIKNAKKIL
ncbi:glycosyltransferase [Mucilaginibacter terrenus]|uniref:Glycosyltransferase n=1 Tax=Mucilaginibacter terrenus TaxID=2482727 RepID=A0A3E2NXM1_9SPHI|nr:glycosyltransferase family 4 protein [Mucilaginibacter terrenus]RFZ85765.1 glycosyltransferase [Mucilaginibacter terrenus]